MCVHYSLHIICYSTLPVRALVIFLRQTFLLSERAMTHEVGDEMQFIVDAL